MGSGLHSSLNELNCTTDYVYQSYTRLTQVIDSLIGTTSFQYDANGNITKVTDAKLHDTHFDYNSINKLTVINIKKNGVKKNEKNGKMEWKNGEKWGQVLFLAKV